MSLDQVFGSLKSLNEYREEIPPADVSLRIISKVLGVKDKPKMKKIEDQINKIGFPSFFTFTKEQMQEWNILGMPNPTEFLRNYKRKK